MMMILFLRLPAYRIANSSLVILFFLAACSQGEAHSIQPSTATPDTMKMPSDQPTTEFNGDLYPPNQLAPTQGFVLATPDQGSSVPLPSSTFPAYTPTSLPPDYWMSMPVIPSVSQTAREIYQKGVQMGRDPHAFSKIGDCQSISTYFLKYFDIPDYYRLGDYAPLQESIDWYSGSFSRDSLAVKGGFNAAAILSPLRADSQQCHPDENPIACEFRLHNPSLAIISLEEWWAGHPENYETYMRRIIEYSLQQGVLPIIATKADNIEGNHLINQTIARLALEYDLPLWNFWLAVQPLPNHGLIEVDSNGVTDRFHLTHSENYYFYDDPNGKPSGWSVRNLTALQAIDAVRRGLIDNP